MNPMEGKRYPVIDTHVHINEIADLEGSVRRAQSVGIKAIIAVGSDLVSNEEVLQIAQTFPALGFHPWQINAGQLEATIGAMDSEAERCVAFGDVGIDLKGFELATFMSITGVQEDGLAKKYLETAWKACRYLVNHHRGKVFLGIGVPYNKDLISLEEVHRIGQEIAFMDTKVQVCLLDYRPEFRRRYIDEFRIHQPDYREMAGAAEVLREAGLKIVIAQTLSGHIGP